MTTDCESCTYNKDGVIQLFCINHNPLVRILDADHGLAYFAAEDQTTAKAKTRRRRRRATRDAAAAVKAAELLKTRGACRNALVQCRPPHLRRRAQRKEADLVAAISCLKTAYGSATRIAHAEIATARDLADSLDAELKAKRAEAKAAAAAADKTAAKAAAAQARGDATDAAVAAVSRLFKRKLDDAAFKTAAERLLKTYATNLAFDQGS